MRLGYVTNPSTHLSPEDREVLERIEARRGASGLLSLDLTLLIAPTVADGMCIRRPLKFAKAQSFRLEYSDGCHTNENLARS